jgi:hypothetical protein
MGPDADAPFDGEVDMEGLRDTEGDAEKDDVKDAARVAEGDPLGPRDADDKPVAEALPQGEPEPDAPLVGEDDIDGLREMDGDAEKEPERETPGEPVGVGLMRDDTETDCVGASGVSDHVGDSLMTAVFERVKVETPDGDGEPDSEYAPEGVSAELREPELEGVTDGELERDAVTDSSEEAEAESVTIPEGVTSAVPTGDGDAAIVTEGEPHDEGVGVAAYDADGVADSTGDAVVTPLEDSVTDTVAVGEETSEKVRVEVTTLETLLLAKADMETITVDVSPDESVAAIVALTATESVCDGDSLGDIESNVDALEVIESSDEDESVAG